MHSMKLSILIPVYNERRTLRSLIRRVTAVPMPCPFEIVAVDDCSTDGSREILQKLAEEDARIKVIFHEHNSGKGAAIHTAIKHLTGDVAIVQDADLEYEPSEIPRVITPILEGRADACFGSRYAGRESRRVLYYWHSVMNKTLTWLTNLVTDLDLTDMETCYKAVRTDILKQTPLKLKRFGIEPELTLRLAQWGARIFEVPISYSGRTYAEGKKITWKDGMQAVGAIFWAGFIDRRFTTHSGFYHAKAVRGPKVNHWMFETIKPFVGQNIVEAGCGIGNLTELMLSRESLTCFDIDPLYVELIQRRFSHLENFTALKVDINDVTLNNLRLTKRPDTVICLNVLEYLEDDAAAIKKLCNLLEPGGQLILMVPQHTWMYNGMDQNLGHKRRYDRTTLNQKLEESGFILRKTEDFNRLGYLGWLGMGKILGSKSMPTGAMKAFNLVLPLAKKFDAIKIFPGITLVAIAQKPMPTVADVESVESPQLAASHP